MAMSLEQPINVEAAPVQEVGEDTAMPVTPHQSGEHAAELTPIAALADPIGELTIDTDAKTVVLSPARRASVSDTSLPREHSPRSRNKSAAQRTPCLAIANTSVSSRAHQLCYSLSLRAW